MEEIKRTIELADKNKISEREGLVRIHGIAATYLIEHNKPNRHERRKAKKHGGKK